MISWSWPEFKIKTAPSEGDTGKSVCAAMGAKLFILAVAISDIR
jgi:hypothetical protein